MSIIDLVRKENMSIGLKYYGPNDLATGINVGYLLETSSKIYDYYKDKIIAFESFDNFLDYLYLDHISKYEEIQNIIVSNRQDEFKDLVSFAKDKLDEIDNRELISFLNMSYLEIFENECDHYSLDICEKMVLLIAKFYGGVSDEVKIYAINNKSYIIYDNLDLFYSKFTHDTSKLKLLLSEENITKDIEYRFGEITALIIRINQSKNEELKSIANSSTAIIIKHIQEKYFASSVDKVMETNFRVKSAFDFLSALQNPEAYIFQEEIKNQEVILDQYLMEFRKKFNISIDFGPVIKMFEDPTVSWSRKAILLTHTRIDGKTEWISFFENAVQNFKRSIFIDLVPSNIKTNEYFLESNLINIELSVQSYSQMILYHILDNDRKEILFNYFNSGIMFFSEKIGISPNIFSEDIDLLSQYIDRIYLNEIHKTDLEIRTDIYGLCMYLCGMIEKLLRTVYINLQRETIYIPSQMITLGTLLDYDSNKTLVDVLGFDQMRCLRYYLLVDKGDNRVGRNIRNDLAHLSESMKISLNRNTPIQLLLFLNSVINSLVLYYINKADI